MVQRVQRGRHSPSEGHPKSAVLPESIDAMLKIMKSDRLVTYVEIVLCLDITSTNRIEDLT